MNGIGPYRHRFSPLKIRNSTLLNRAIFGPVCRTWVRSPHEGIFTEQAVAYYEERAKTGLGMIILIGGWQGAGSVWRSTSPLLPADPLPPGVSPWIRNIPTWSRSSSCLRHRIIEQ